MKFTNKTWELKETLQETAERLNRNGFIIEVLNCGHMFQAYLDGDMVWEDVPGYKFKHCKGIAISVEETYRHNGTDENVNIDMRVYKYKDSSGTLQGKDEKKIRFRMDASEKVKNKRIEEIIDRYNRFK